MMWLTSREHEKWRRSTETCTLLLVDGKIQVILNDVLISLFVLHMGPTRNVARPLSFQKAKIEGADSTARGLVTNRNFRQRKFYEIFL